jgi:hypothetical protein
MSKLNCFLTAAAASLILSLWTPANAASDKTEGVQKLNQTLELSAHRRYRRHHRYYRRYYRSYYGPPAYYYSGYPYGYGPSPYYGYYRPYYYRPGPSLSFGFRF